jgi:regulator of replication initiation timing
MSRPSIFSKENAIAYLNANAEAGNPIPTLRSLRETLKGGSFTTLAAIIKEWKEAREEPAVKFKLKLNNLKESEKDQLLQDVFSQLFEQFVIDEIEHHRKHIDYQVQLLETDAQTLLEDNARLEKENAALRETNAKQKAAFDERLKNQQQEFDQRLSALVAESQQRAMEQMKASVEERLALQAQIQSLAAEISDLKEQVQAAEKSAKKTKVSVPPPGEEATPVEDTRTGNLFEE